MRAFFLLTFVTGAIIGSLGRSPWMGFDEITHLSYIAQIQSTGDLWPRLESLRILDGSMRFSDAQSYLNHPPIYYDILASLGPRVEGNPGSILILRLMNIAIVAAGIVALLALGGSLGLARLEEYVWLIALLLTPVLSPLAGTVNNDNLAFAAGAVALLATYRMNATQQPAWLLAALAAVIFAGMAKLTGLLLVGGLVAGVLAYMAMTERSPRWWLGVAAAAALIAAAPYIVLWAQYGSPAPSTGGQIGLLTTHVDTIGLKEVPQHALSFPEYASFFVTSFIRQWMPSETPLTPLQISIFAAPVFALICALLGAAGAAKRILRREGAPIDIVVVSGFAAAAATAALHLVFSYRHHVDYAIIGGMPTYSFTPDAYPRYYLPVGAIVPLGCLLFLASHNGFTRKALAAMLISGPIAFEILAAPGNDVELATLDIYRHEEKAGVATGRPVEDRR